MYFVLLINMLSLKKLKQKYKREVREFLWISYIRTHTWFFQLPITV